MHSQVFRNPILWVLTLVVCAGLAVALSARVTRGDPPPPTPVPGMQTSGTPTDPGRGRPPYFVRPDVFAGRVVHLVGTNYSFSEGSKDPANGRLRNFNAWLRFGPGGAPDLFHLVSTYEDGSFHQEILTTPTEEIVVSEPAAAITSPDGSPVCLVRGTPAREMLESRVPYFVNQSALPQFGFQSQGSGPPSHVSRPAPPALSPGAVETFQSEPAVQRWTRQQPSGPSGMRTTHTLEVTNAGRVQVLQTQTIDASGRVVGDMWTANGPLEVFNPAAVPQNAFSLTREGCSA
jgi:hypothetical protein